MIKSLSVIIFAFALSLAGIAQNDVTVHTDTLDIGQSLITGRPIRAIKRTTSDRVYMLEIDTLTNRAMVQLRGLQKEKWLANKGYVFGFDLDSNQVLWSKKLSYQAEGIEYYAGMTLHTTGTKCYMLDNETGKQIWEVENSIIFADVKHKIGMGYRIKSPNGSWNTLEGFNLETGRMIWQRQINRSYGWNHLLHLNDSTLLVGAAGLHTINIFDGTGWDYYSKTGDRDYTAGAIGTGLGLAAGLLTGMYSVSAASNVVRDLVSNVIVDSTHIYMASKGYLVKFTKDGKKLWATKLPSDSTSASSIQKSGKNLIMINRGSAYMGLRQIDYGTPYLASFNMETGKQNHLKVISNKKKEYIKDIHQSGDTLLFIFNERVSIYTASDGNEIHRLDISAKEYGKLKHLIGHQVYVERDSHYLSIPELDTNKYFLYTDEGNILRLSSELEIEEEIELSDFHIRYYQEDGKHFIAKGNKTFVVDTEGKKLAEIDASARTIYSKGKLYSMHENSFIEIDVEEILKNTSD